ncbi:hypothetical protein HXA35_19000 [Bacillus sp. A301a_S52]|jgi:hypothetical protein|nr:hypothetical protein [Bacillus sp. A301a_S52]
MVGHSSPFAGRYFRYVLSILVFGLLGPVMLWSQGMLPIVTSLLLAVLCTIGYDAFTHVFVRVKSLKIVNEKPLLSVHATKIGPESKGFIVLTDRFVIFVPLWKKIKTVLHTKHIVRHEFEGERLEVTAKFRNKHRTFEFYVSSPERVKLLLEEKSGRSLPYKYDKQEKHPTL